MGVSFGADYVPMSCELLHGVWRQLNVTYFRGRLLPIQIIWSRRLTASVGMFVSHVGPRAPWAGHGVQNGERRLIRLSIPLLQDQSRDEVIGTLAHEMIHQWQYDILKRRPNHGPDFHRMMAAMNRDGLGITIRHSLETAVRALAKYTWRCTECGRDYHRQRRTLRPGHHRCGECFGKLRELSRSPFPDSPAKKDRATSVMPCMSLSLVQMPLPFGR